MAKTLDNQTQQPNVAGADKCDWVVRREIGLQNAVKQPIGPDKCDWVVRAQDQGATAATGTTIRKPGADKCDWVVSAGTQEAQGARAAKPGPDKCDWVVKNRPDETSR